MCTKDIGMTDMRMKNCKSSVGCDCELTWSFDMSVCVKLESAAVECRFP